MKVANEISGNKTRRISSGVYSRCEKASRRQRRGFTLVELLVVIAIIALLMGILMPALNIAQKKAMFAVCKSGFHQIGLATLMYAEENRYRLSSGCYFNFPNGTGGDSSGNGIAYEPGIDTEGFIAIDAQPYLGSTKLLSTDFSIFICPADKLTRESPAGFDGTTAQYGSISPNGATTEEWYKSGHLSFYSGNMTYWIYYYYLGNYPFELTKAKPSYNPGELLGEKELAKMDKGLIYPKNSTGPRAKIMQDMVTQANMDYFGLISSHKGYNPNGLFTDGSVEGLALSSLSGHGRPAGIMIEHHW